MKSFSIVLCVSVLSVLSGCSATTGVAPIQGVGGGGSRGGDVTLHSETADSSPRANTRAMNDARSERRSGSMFRR